MIPSSARRRFRRGPGRLILTAQDTRPRSADRPNRHRDVPRGPDTLLRRYVLGSHDKVRLLSAIWSVQSGDGRQSASQPVTASAGIGRAMP